MRVHMSAAISVIMASLGLAAPAGAQGIERIITVTQQQAENADPETLQGADRQRDLIRQQREAREAQRQKEALRAAPGTQIDRSAAAKATPTCDVTSLQRTRSRTRRENGC